MRNLLGVDAFRFFPLYTWLHSRKGNLPLRLQGLTLRILFGLFC